MAYGLGKSEALMRWRLPGRSLPQSLNDPSPRKTFVELAAESGFCARVVVRKTRAMPNGAINNFKGTDEPTNLLVHNNLT